MTSAVVQTEVETAALAICTCSVWESSHTFSFTAFLVIHTLEYFFWKHAHSLSALRDTTWPWPLQSSSYHRIRTHAQLSFWGGGILAMNNVILTKWCVALSSNYGVLENHWKIVWVQGNDKWWVQYPVIYGVHVWIVGIASVIIVLSWWKGERGRKKKVRR